MGDFDLSPEFLEELRGDFAVEAAEHLQTIVTGLLDLEKDLSSPAREQVYRAAHSMKGAAHAVQLPLVASLCQALESVLSGIRKGLLRPDASGFDLLQRTADTLGTLVGGGEDPEALRLEQALEALARGNPILCPRTAETSPAAPTVSPPPPAPAPAPEVSGIQERPRQAPRAPLPPMDPPQGPQGEPAPDQGRETVRLETRKLDALLLQSEELLSLKLALAQRLSEAEEVLDLLAPWRKDWDRLIQGLRGAGVSREGLRPPLEANRSRLEALQDRMRRLRRELHRDLLSADRSLTSLMESAKGVLMLPASTILQAFPRALRDLCRKLGREAELTLEGEDTSLDKRILEGLKDPLLHLLRNGVDHGLEPPEERERAGKPRCGTLALRILRGEGNRVEILLSDDGRGIDPEALRRSAVRSGALTPQEAEGLDEASALGLLFRSGVSTSPLVTDISGRGLGMAIVEEGVQKLGGTVSVESRKGEGTTFRLSLPLTLATFRGVLVQEWGRPFLIPTAGVRRVLRLSREEIVTVGGRQTLMRDGTPLGLVRLGSVLGLPPREETRPHLPVLVLASGSSALGFVVDRIRDEQEALLKPLGPQLRRVRHLAGATVLGSGEVVPVLHTGDLLRTAQAGGSAALSARQTPAKRPSILLVEDSITSRTLLRNILTAAGYDVTTAVDGQEGWDLLRQQGADLVVTDVEMPRMTGFELTAQIRSEPNLRDLPVVLVTSLETREDRERGVEVGADAYLVKRGFDQENLLDTVRRLL